MFCASCVCAAHHLCGDPDAAAAAATGTAIRGICAIGRNRAFNQCVSANDKFDRAPARTPNSAHALAATAAECGGLIENAVTISAKRIAGTDATTTSVTRACTSKY